MTRHRLFEFAVCGVIVSATVLLSLAFQNMIGKQEALAKAQIECHRDRGTMWEDALGHHHCDKP
jgi:hypothetical protein